MRFTDEQIIGISQATFYKFKSKYAGLEASYARKIRALENENNKLKKPLAEQMLDTKKQCE